MSPSPSHLATPNREAPHTNSIATGSTAIRSNGVSCKGHASAQEATIVKEEHPLVPPAPPPAEMASTDAVDQVRKLHVLVTRLHALVTKLQADNRRLRAERDKARQKTATARAETARTVAAAMASACARDEEEAHKTQTYP